MTSRASSNRQDDPAEDAADEDRRPEPGRRAEARGRSDQPLDRVRAETPVAVGKRTGESKLLLIDAKPVLVVTINIRQFHNLEPASVAFAADPRRRMANDSWRVRLVTGTDPGLVRVINLKIILMYLKY